MCAEGRRLGERHPSGRGGVAVRGLPAGAARRRGRFGGAFGGVELAGERIVRAILLKHI